MAKPSLKNKRTSVVKNNSKEIIDSNINSEIAVTVDDTNNDNESIIDITMENIETGEKRLNRSTIENLSSDAITEGLYVEVKEPIKKEKINLYVEREVLDKIITQAKCSNRSMTSTASLILTNAVKNFTIDVDAVEEYNESIKNRKRKKK